MRTTVNLPDDLLRRAKVHAAEHDLTLMEVFVAGLEKELSSSQEKPRGRHRPVPVRIENVDWTFPFRTNAELFEAIEQEEEK